VSEAMSYELHFVMSTTTPLHFLSLFSPSSPQGPEVRSNVQLTSHGIRTEQFRNLHNGLHQWNSIFVFAYLSLK
jgi:hypothetical protein